MRRRRLLATSVLIVGGVIATAIALNNGGGAPSPESAAPSTTTTPTTSTPAPTPTPTSGVETTSTSRPRPATATTTRRPTTTTTPATASTSTSRPGPPTVAVVTPQGGLSEWGTATFIASGLPPSKRLFAHQCPAAGIDPNGDICDEPAWLYSPNQGDLWSNEHGGLHPGSDGAPLRRVINPKGPRQWHPRGATVDCAAEPCVLAIFAHDGVRHDPLVVAPLTFAGPPGPPRPMTARAAPTRDLTDGQVVTVTGEEAYVRSTVGLYQCGRVEDREVCTPPTSTTVDERGAFSGTIVVHPTFTSNGVSVDCRAVPCWIAPDPDHTNTISFADDVPPPDHTGSEPAQPAPPPHAQRSMSTRSSPPRLRCVSESQGITAGNQDRLKDASRA
jgi:hypothetical protein